MNWTSLKNIQEISSPCLLVAPCSVQANIERMIEIVGGGARTKRLRTHVKTHKMSEIIEMQVAAGITKFKTATLSEAEMAAASGAEDVLVAHQVVGPKISRLATLRKEYQSTRFSTVVDNLLTMSQIASALGSESNPIRLWIDVDCGMGRTGIKMGSQLDKLRAGIEANHLVAFAGLHVYDGHIHDSRLQDRQNKVQPIIQALRDYVATNNVPAIVGGGTPTFNSWATETTWECSPGTPLLWDVGYGRAYRDLSFDIAAALVTRVISKPGSNRLCLDLGHKSVASEIPLADRVVFPTLPSATFVLHGEEHLVIESDEAENYSVGDPLIAYPKHICPTVALYDAVSLVEENRITSKRWRVIGRDQSISPRDSSSYMA